MQNNNELKLQGIYSKGYGIVSKLVMQDTNITMASKCLYAYICSYAGGGNTAYPSISKICNDLQIKNEDTYRKHMKLLIENGYISITKTRNKEGKFDRNIYTINLVLNSKSNESTENSEVNPTPKKTGTEKNGDGKKRGRKNWVHNNNSFFNNNNSINNNNKESSSEKENEQDSENKKQFSENDLEYKLSKYLFSKMKKVNINAKQPNLKSWSKHIDYMLRLDKITKEDIKDIIDFSQSDSFWCTVIRSTSKLREKYETLYLRLQEKNNKSNQNKSNTFNNKTGGSDYYEKNNFVGEKNVGW